MKRWGSARAGWWALPPLAVLACGPGSTTDVSQRFDEYFLGGQTGSLIPDCDVAPLSSQGRGVPAGDALAVWYAKGCPDAVADGELTVTGPGDRPIGITLEPLDGAEGAYLVRADRALEAGSYDLALDERQSREVAVNDEVAMLPQQLGQLTFVPGEEACGDVVSFELELTPEALSYVPLMRWFVSVDQGVRQLWVDYGALELLEPERSGRARLTLPRCGGPVCLETGRHSVRARAEVAGESEGSQSLDVSFELDCGEPLTAMTEAEPARCSAAALDGSASPAPHAFVSALSLAALTALARRARRRR